MPARHVCADALASCAAPRPGARQTALSRCGRRFARRARDCRCPRAEGCPAPGRRRPVDASITRCDRRGGDASKARMCRCASELRRAGDRAHGRPREADADEGSQGEQGTAGARAPRVAPHRADDGPSMRRSRAATGAAAMPARHACADALASCAAPVIGRTADRAKPTRTQVREASKGLPVPARRRSPQPGPTTARRAVDHALRQARRRCPRGTHVPMHGRAAPRRLFAGSATKKGGRSPPDHFRMNAT
jgi:hypothetical protein